MKTIKFREFTTSSGKIVLGGKDAESNEELMKKFMDKSAIVLHTKEPGSPFCVLESNNKKDIEEASVFCAKYSQAWKKAKVKKDIIDEFNAIDSMDEKNLEEAKEQLIGLKRLAKEESSNVMNELMYAQLQGDVDEYYDYENRVRKVKLADVKKLAKSLIGKYSTAAIVPK